MALTGKQRAFVSEYLVDLNGTEAARRAKYKGDTATLAVIASENLRKPNIRAEIDARLNEQAMSAQEVLARLTMQGRTDLSPYMSSNYFGKITLDLEAVKRAGLGPLIKKITNTKDGSSIEFYDAQAALVQLGRYHKLFTDRTEVDDWRSEFIALIRDGKYDYETLRREIGDELAQDLFKSVGLPVATTGTGETGG